MKIYIVLSLAVLACVLLPSEALPEICLLPKKPGLCKGYFPRYYWNDTTQKCEAFVYGGCSGNGNNFETLENCVAACGPGATDNVIACERRGAIYCQLSVRRLLQGETGLVLRNNVLGVFRDPKKVARKRNNNDNVCMFLDKRSVSNYYFHVTDGKRFNQDCFMSQVIEADPERKMKSIKPISSKGDKYIY